MGANRRAANPIQKVIESLLGKVQLSLQRTGANNVVRGRAGLNFKLKE